MMKNNNNANKKLNFNGLKTNYFILGLLAIALISCSNDEKDTFTDELSILEENSTEVKVLMLNETDFYTPPNNYAVTKNLVQDYGVDKIFATDDSKKLQEAINDVSSKGGGKLLIPKGEYTVSEIKLKSNVHIVVNSEAVFRPSTRPDNKNYAMFTFGKESAVVKNVSISSSNGEKFTVDLTKANNSNVAVFNLNNISNFLISDFRVKDALTKFSAVTMGITEFNNKYMWPTNGVVKNAVTLNSDYGYGLVQVQAAKNVLYKNLKGTGGVTLRFETGWTFMNDLQIGGVHDMYGENISCTNGNAAVMVSPHAMHNGKVYVNGITANSCGFAVRIEGGFVSKKYSAPGLVDGTFSKVTINNVNATYGNKDAQLKPKHYKFMPCDLRDLIDENPITAGGESYWGPSISAVLNTPNYKVVLNKKTVSGTGFKNGFIVQTEEDAVSDTDCN
ncbi:Iota-carrageenase A2 [Cellulophaga omnivescoria]|uniref:Iota-carrageenase A2 n=1 Tax=Cellulophaga omnivescoria TaxID=1888890 RepID=UPI0011155E86|nr:Iota-carrageenase A2 [Cellulophaga omnivescoria]